jgi:hypothetical protein
MGRESRGIIHLECVLEQ